MMNLALETAVLDAAMLLRFESRISKFASPFAPNAPVRFVPIKKRRFGVPYPV